MWINREKGFDKSNLLFTHHKIDFLSLSETFLCSLTDNAEIGGYTFESKNRDKGNGGGVVAYIRDGIPYTRREDLECEDLELKWIEISFKDAKRFLVGVLYRPPDSSKHLNKNFLKKFDNTLTAANMENKEIIILGDMNCNYDHINDHRDIKQLLLNFGFRQLINKPTRTTENTSTLIDVILTNSPDKIVHNDVILCHLSDHDMIGAIRKQKQQKHQPKVIITRNFKRYNADTVRNEIKIIDWKPLTDSNNPTYAWTFLREKLNYICDKHVPFIKKTIKGKSCPWLTDNLKDAMNYRDNLLRSARKKGTEVSWRAHTNDRKIT